MNGMVNLDSLQCSNACTLNGTVFYCECSCRRIINVVLTRTALVGCTERANFALIVQESGFNFNFKYTLYYAPECNDSLNIHSVIHRKLILWKLKEVTFLRYGPIQFSICPPPPSPPPPPHHPIENHFLDNQHICHRLFQVVRYVW